MRRWASVGIVVAVAVLTGSAQSASVITETRAAIKAGNFAQAREVVAKHRAESGVTPQLLEAISWIGRGALAAGALDQAETAAREAYDLASAMAKTRPLGDNGNANLPIALGAAIEVLGQVQVQRGARTEAVAFLQKEFQTYGKTSIGKRLQKNINLASLEGQSAPALDLSEYLGPKPPALASLKGQVVLMFFWAHWCADCKQQGPVLATLADKYRNRGLVVLAPTQRYGYVAGGKTAPAADETKYIDQIRSEFYPVLAGQSVPIAEANHLRYGVSTTPTLVLVDRAGIVRLYNPGKLTLEQLEPKVAALLGAT